MYKTDLSKFRLSLSTNFFLTFLAMATGSKQAYLNRVSEFSLDVFKRCLKSSLSDNVFMSPASIFIALTMVKLGAKNNTLDQMMKALKCVSLAKEEILGMASQFMSSLKKQSNYVLLRSANRLYPRADKIISEEYLSMMKTHFGSTVMSMDFVGNPEGSRTEINNWVKDETNGKIKNLLPEGAIEANTAMILINALYFRGSWLNMFPEGNTKATEFYGTKGDVKVEMMHAEFQRGKFNKSSGLQCKLLALPYKGRDYSMIIILPNARNGLETMMQQLNVSKLNSLVLGMRSHRVKAQIPKFRIESTFELKPVLSAMGMSDVFDEDKADLSGTGKDLYVSHVFHKAFVDINEKGTEAAAATAVEEKDRCRQPPAESFIADHPFMFLIWDTNLCMPLFIGSYSTPETFAKSEKFSQPTENLRCRKRKYSDYDSDS